VTKTKTLNLSLDLVEEGRCSNLAVQLCWEGQDWLPCNLPIPSSSWLVDPLPSISPEQYAELLLSGDLQHSMAKQCQVHTTNFPGLVTGLAGSLGLCLVEIQGDSTASLYGEEVKGTKLAFLIKKGSEGVLSLEGRAEDKQLLEGILNQAERSLG